MPTNALQILKYAAIRKKSNKIRERGTNEEFAIPMKGCPQLAADS